MVINDVRVGPFFNLENLWNLTRTLILRLFAVASSSCRAASGR